jgi:hypothetical protein
MASFELIPSSEEQVVADVLSAFTPSPRGRRDGFV